MKALLSLWLLLTTSLVWAHDYHAVRTQVQLNEQTGSVEIIHRAFVSDLNQVVSLQRQTKTELGQNNSDEHWVMSYWNQYFGLLDQQGNPIQLQWVGMEIDQHDLWVYQEYQGDLAALLKAKVHNGLLFGQFDHQVNTVDVKLGQQQAALVFTEGNIQQPILTSAMTEPATKSPHSH